MDNSIELGYQTRTRENVILDIDRSIGSGDFYFQTSSDMLFFSEPEYVTRFASVPGGSIDRATITFDPNKHFFIDETGNSWLESIGSDSVDTNDFVLWTADDSGDRLIITTDPIPGTDTLVAYDFNRDSVNPSAPTIVAEGIEASSISSPMNIAYPATIGDNSGVDAFAAELGDDTLGALGISVAAATTSSFAAAAVGDDYISFTVTPREGVMLELTSVSFKGTKRSSGSVDQYALADADGNLIGSIHEVVNVNGLIGTYESISISLKGTEYSTIVDPTEFRIYAWGRGTTRTSGTLAAIDKVLLRGEEAQASSIAYYDFSRDSQHVVEDISGNEFDAKIENAVVDRSTIELNGSSSRVKLPSEIFAELGNQVTIAMWVYGDVQPRNQTVFNAVNASGERVMNIHLPWGNSQVYWDAGNDGGIHDRIQKVASPSSYAGQWNHWAFTKNINTGEMAMYLNGELFSSEVGNTLPFSEITEAAIGYDIAGDNRYYDGMIDDFIIYPTAFTAEQVEDLFTSTSLSPIMHFNFNREGTNHADNIVSSGGSSLNANGIISNGEQTGGSVILNGINTNVTISSLAYSRYGAFGRISDEITIAMLVKGGNDQPRADTIFNAVDANGNRILNIHLPWGNSQVYWDAGFDGVSFDRINKVARPANFNNQWNHWAFTKNAKTGTMAIYLKGELFHSGVGANAPMTGITDATIGADTLDTLFYSGSIDDFILFDSCLSAEEIAELHTMTVE